MDASRACRTARASTRVAIIAHQRAPLLARAVHCTRARAPRAHARTRTLFAAARSAHASFILSSAPRYRTALRLRPRASNIALLSFARTRSFIALTS